MLELCEYTSLQIWKSGLSQRGYPTGHHQLNNLENRRGFLLQLGLARHEAYDLAKSTNFDVRRLERIQQVYFARGYRPEEVMGRIVSDVRDRNNWVENIEHEEQAPSRNRSPEPTFSRNFDEHHMVKKGDYKYKNRRNRSRSRSPAHNAFRIDQPSKRHGDGKYSFRDDMRREAFREKCYTPVDEDSRHVSLRYFDRDVSPSRDRLAEYHMSQLDHFRSRAGQANTRKERSRSYSPEKFTRKLNVYSPFKDDRSLSSRPFSPIRRVSQSYCSRSHSPAGSYQREERFRSSRSRSPSRDINEDHHPHYEAIKDFRGERYRTSREKDDEIKRFREEKSRELIDSSCRSGFDIRRNYFRNSSEESPVEFHSEHDENGEQLAFWEPKRTSSACLLDDCKQNYTYSLEERSPERFKVNRSEHRFESPNRLSPNERNIPSLLSLNIFPEKIPQFRRSSSREYSPPRKSPVPRHNNIPSLLSLEVYPEQTHHPELRGGARSGIVLQDDNSTNKICKRPSSRDYSKPRKLHTSRNNNIPSLLSLKVHPEQQPQSELRQGISEKHLQRYKLTNKKYKQPSSRDYAPPRKIPTTHHNNIPSLLSLKVHPEQKQSELNLRNLNTSAPLSFDLTPNTNSNQQQVISREPVLYQQPSNEEIQSVHSKNNSNVQIKQPNIVNNETQLRKNIANIPVIHSGLAKPLPGFLKANPRDYWSKWWPHFKYIEYSIPKINPNDSDIKTCLNYMLEPNTCQARNHKTTLIEKSITTIMKTKDINETNYYKQDIFKIFQYKKHLEDPNFQNSLTPDELNSIAAALRQFQIRTIMAFLHQALIVKWHLSLEIRKKVRSGEPVKSSYATQLLNNKSFHYLVMESIQELKKMCQKDWPAFDEFYKTLRAKKVDIYSLGVGPQCHPRI